MSDAETISLDQLVADVSKHCGYTQIVVRDVIYSLRDYIKSETLAGRIVKIRGFGTFRIVERPEKRGVNVRTGEMITVPARKVLKFSPSRVLIRSIQDK